MMKFSQTDTQFYHADCTNESCSKHIWVRRTKTLDDFIAAVRKSTIGSKHYIVITVRFKSERHSCSTEKFVNALANIIDERGQLTRAEDRTRAILFENLIDTEVVFLVGHRLSRTTNSKNTSDHRWHDYNCGLTLHLQNKLRGRVYSCIVTDQNNLSGKFCPSLPWKLMNKVDLYENGYFEILPEIREALKSFGYTLNETSNNLLPSAEREPEILFDDNFQHTSIEPTSAPANKMIRRAASESQHGRKRIVNFSQEEKNSQFMFDKSLLNEPVKMSKSGLRLNMLKTFQSHTLIPNVHQIEFSKDPNTFYTSLRDVQSHFHHEWQDIDQQKIQEAIVEGGATVGRLVRKITNTFIYMYNQIDEIISKKRITFFYNQKYLWGVHSFDDDGVRTPVPRRDRYQILISDVHQIFLFL